MGIVYYDYESDYGSQTNLDYDYINYDYSVPNDDQDRKINSKFSAMQPTYWDNNLVS